ncbi:hypothetical protein MKK64_08710 [Methylobacterium sp. E-025]|uniref:hypothetical protein n=1 Tax=Methylobacterium sp. E-025 TaxID=2836561 RepID=UPI001FBBD059|nr:hypothetical protein [Methylobacterium sp. E-025]MCJ2111270.1 hypothetical protein [Methylobacterium sp. E-025]
MKTSRCWTIFPHRRRRPEVHDVVSATVSVFVSQEGRHARDHGEPIGANPYPEGSDEHATCERG